MNARQESTLWQVGKKSGKYQATMQRCKKSEWWRLKTDIKHLADILNFN